MPSKSRLTAAQLKRVLDQHAKGRDQWQQAFAAVETSEHPIDSPAGKKLVAKRDDIGKRLEACAGKLRENGYTLEHFDSVPVPPAEPEAPKAVALADAKKGEHVRIGRKAFKGKVWGPRVLGIAPAAEGEEALVAGESGPTLALQPPWMKMPIYVALADVTICEVKRNGAYLPVELG